MHLVVQLKLKPSAEQRAALLDTLVLCNENANFVSEIAYANKVKNKAPSKYDLQKIVYHELKERGLASQAVLRVIGKVVDAYTAQKGSIKSGALSGKAKEKAESKPVRFRKYAAQPFEDRNLSWQLEQGTVSIWSVAGRLKSVPFEGDQESLDLLKYCRKGETDLLERGGVLFLAAGIEIPEVDDRVVTDFLAFDSGIVNIATTSDGMNWSGGAVTERRRKNKALRKKLQQKGTKSAKRLLKKRSGKESRFVKDVNHCTSKEIVKEAKRTGRGVAHENLKGIRERVRLTKLQRGELHSWAFAQLFEFVGYKARLAGLPVMVVNPAYSSQLCPACGTVGRQNRPSRDEFKCSSCSHSGPADHVAAQNLRSFALAEYPKLLAERLAAAAA
jgi:IS605 OrfB family transposase